MAEWFTNIRDMLLDALFPEHCVVCNRPLVSGERFICLHCDDEMPTVDIHPITDNAMHSTLASTKPIHMAAAFLRYRRGSSYTRLIHVAKYGDCPQMAVWLGNRLAQHSKDSGLFEGAEALVPIPLNGWKMMMRGYNQSEKIAQGLSGMTGIPVVNLLKAKPHGTQTRKNALRRRIDAGGVYFVKNHDEVRRMTHVILVDDVVTTGSTITACASALYEVNPSVTISVASAALTCE